jgi:hypothetical protein
MLKEFFKSGFSYFKEPNPPKYPTSAYSKFLTVFYGVCGFEMIVFIILWIVYPDRFYFFQYFFSEFGAPITKIGSSNIVGMVIFSVNMILGSIGTLSFIPLIAKLFPQPKDQFYRTLRYAYYACIIVLSIGLIFVALPYTTHWIPHVLGGFACIFAMWGAWCIFILFNTKWSLSIRLTVLIILNLFCAFIFISLMLQWNMELLQKPGQGLVTLIVVIWPYIHYLLERKRNS